MDASLRVDSVAVSGRAGRDLPHPFGGPLDVDADHLGKHAAAQAAAAAGPAAAAGSPRENVVAQEEAEHVLEVAVPPEQSLSRSRLELTYG